MKYVECDLCHGQFQYGEGTSKTDGNFVTVRMGITNVRVCLSVKAYLVDKGDHADICPNCRRAAIESVLNGTADTIPRYQTSRNNQRRLRN